MVVVEEGGSRRSGRERPGGKRLRLRLRLKKGEREPSKKKSDDDDNATLSQSRFLSFSVTPCQNHAPGVAAGVTLDLPLQLVGAAEAERAVEGRRES